MARRQTYPAGTKYSPRDHGDPQEFQENVNRVREAGVDIAVDHETGKVTRVPEPHRYAVYAVDGKVTKRDAPELDAGGMQMAARDDNGELIPRKGAKKGGPEAYEVVTKKVPHAERVEGQVTYTDERGREVLRFEGQLHARSTNPRRAAEVARAVAAAEGRPMAVLDRRTGQVISVAE